MIRRTKKEHTDVLEIPPKILTTELIQLNAGELEYYEKMYILSKSKFTEMYNKGAGGLNFGHVYTLILRLR